MGGSYKYYICYNKDVLLELTKDEEAALDGKHGETLALAYRVLVAIGDATGSDKLIPIEWAHLSGVNYNTIGEGRRISFSTKQRCQIQSKDNSKSNGI